MFFYLAELASCMYIPAKMKTLTTHSLINWLVIARGQLLCTAAAPNVAGGWTCTVEDPSYLFSSNPEYLIFTCWFVIIGYLSKIMYPYDNFCINTRVSKPTEIWKILSVLIYGLSNQFMAWHKGWCEIYVTACIWKKKYCKLNLLVLVINSHFSSNYICCWLD